MQLATKSDLRFSVDEVINDANEYGQVAITERGQKQPIAYLISPKEFQSLTSQ